MTEQQPRNNPGPFWSAMDDPGFLDWACRTAVRLANLPAGCSKDETRKAIVRDGIPPPACAAAFLDIGSRARRSR